jgi:hypothetical protein
MKTLYWWVVLGGLAVMLGLGMAWQRLQRQPMQAEIEVLRDQQQEIGRLQAQSLRAKAELKSREVAGQPAERFGMGVEMPAADWRNAGGATAAAALETVLWAAAGGEVEAFAKRIRFDAAARTAAVELLQSLPPTERARHSSPEALMAFLSIKDVPIGTATVTTWSGRPEVLQSASVTLTAPGEKARRVSLVFVRDGDEWKMRATDTAVAKYAAALRGPTVAAGGGK